jgi:hypothetical protein
MVERAVELQNGVTGGQPEPRSSVENLLRRTAWGVEAPNQLEFAFGEWSSPGAVVRGPIRAIADTLLVSVPSRHLQCQSHRARADNEVNARTIVVKAEPCADGPRVLRVRYRKNTPFLSWPITAYISRVGFGPSDANWKPDTGLNDDH